MSVDYTNRDQSTVFKRESKFTEEETGTPNEFFEHDAHYLNLILKICCIPSANSSIYFKYFNRFICANVLVVGYGSVLYVPLTEMNNDSGAVVMLGRVLFAVYTTTMYTYLSLLAQQKPGIVSILRDIGRIESHNLFAYPCNKNQPIKAVMLIASMLVITNVLLSFMAPQLIFGKHHPAALRYFQASFIFFSVGWQMSIPFVYMGCKSLTEKVKYLIKYIHTEFREENINKCDAPIDLVYLMDWYDELYEKNRLLNKILSGLITLTIAFLAMATTLIALHIALEGFWGSDIFWFFANAFTLLASCYPAGELEIQNALIRIELGTVPISRNLPDLNLFLNQYQTVAIKTSRSQFGIFVKGTKARITFKALIRIASVTLSAIIFLGGVVRS